MTLWYSLDYLEKHADESEDWRAEVEEGGEEAVAGEEAKVRRPLSTESPEDQIS